MKKVLRYSLDEFLEYVNENDSVFDNRADRHIECNIVFKMDDGSYKVLLGDYICDAQLIDGVVVAFREHDIYLETSHFDLEKRCMAYNDRLYLMDDPVGFIDEIYILGTTEQLEDVQYSARLESIARKINTENLSTIEQVELLMDNFDEERHPYFRL